MTCAKTFEPEKPDLNIDEPVDQIKKAFDESEVVLPIGETSNQAMLAEDEAGAVSRPRPGAGEMANGRSVELVNPIVPLGHSGGQYHFRDPSGQIRTLSAEKLEAGRGVRALFLGCGTKINEWCLKMFPARENDWCHKRAGLWIIERCNGQGVFDIASADLRSIGVWRGDDGKAIAHCGNSIMRSDGQCLPLAEKTGKSIAIGSASIRGPSHVCLQTNTTLSLLHELSECWGWKREVDAQIWFGWLAAASLGGFPDWRVHLYVHGCRGSGKSALIELAARLLGDLAGEVVNDATEAGIRQSRNNQARPLLIDEFEPDDNPRNAARHDSILTLFRRMSGGAGGRISRGGSDHSPVSFRTIGAAYVTSINHIQLEPQDRSRFVLLELGAIPAETDTTAAAVKLTKLSERCADISTRFWGRMLAQSQHWDRSLAAITAKARSMGADARQAATAAPIAAGLDLALYDGPIDALRLEDCGPILEALIADGCEADESSEGREALDHLLSFSLSLDHGVKRTVRELVFAEIEEEDIYGVENKIGALRRHSIYVDKKHRRMALRVGRDPSTAKIFDGTKWQNGAHSSALKKLVGVYQPSNPVRIAPNEQQRVIFVPFDCLTG